MRSGRTAALDMSHAPSGDDEGVGNQRPVTAPGHRLGAHDGSRAAGCQLLETRQAGGEVVGLHVVGVAAEGCVVPAEIPGVGAGSAEPAERRQMTVADAGGAERSRESRTVELGIVARTRDRADVHHQLDAVGLEQPDELGDGPSGVPDGVDGGRRRPCRPPGGSAPRSGHSVIASRARAPSGTAERAPRPRRCAPASPSTDRW